MAASQYTHASVEAIYPIVAHLSANTADLPVPPAIMALILGLSFLAGFATGITIELISLRLRERRLAAGRRLLAAQARGLRQQLVNFYRLRDGASEFQHEGNES